MRRQLLSCDLNNWSGLCSYMYIRWVHLRHSQVTCYSSSGLKQQERIVTRITDHIMSDIHVEWFQAFMIQCHQMSTYFEEWMSDYQIKTNNSCQMWGENPRQTYHLRRTSHCLQFSSFYVYMPGEHLLFKFVHPLQLKAMKLLQTCHMTAWWGTGSWARPICFLFLFTVVWSLWKNRNSIIKKLYGTVWYYGNIQTVVHDSLQNDVRQYTST